MTRGTYDFQNPRRRGTDDTSWKTCTCTLLIFATLCGLILLLTWNFRHPYDTDNAQGHSSKIIKDTEIVNGTQNINIKNNSKILMTTYEIETTTVVKSKGHSEEIFEEFEMINGTQNTNAKNNSKLEIESTTIAKNVHFRSSTENVILAQTTEFIDSDYIDENNNINSLNTSPEINYSSPAPVTESYFMENTRTPKIDRSSSTSQRDINFMESSTPEIDNSWSEPATGSYLVENTKAPEIDYSSTTSETEISFMENSTLKIDNLSVLVTGSSVIKNTDSEIITEDSVSTEYMTDNLYSNIETTTNEPEIILEQTTISLKISEPIKNVTNYYENTTDNFENTTVTKLLYSGHTISNYYLKDEASTTSSYSNIGNTTSTKIYRSYSNPYTATPATNIIFNEDDEKTCSTTSCRLRASKILSLMNHNISPCDDLYRFSCDGIQSEYIAEPNLNSNVWKRIEDEFNKINSTSPEYMQYFKTYYTSCFDFDPIREEKSSVEALQSQIKSIGKFYDESADPGDIPRLCELVTDLLNRNFITLFDVRLEIDKDEGTFGLAILPTSYDTILKSVMGNNLYSEECLFKIRSTENNVDLNEMYSKYKECEYNSTSYIATTKAALEYVNAFAESSNSASHIKEVLNTLERNVINVIQSLSPRPSEYMEKLTAKTSEYITLETLKEKLPFLDWDHMFITILGYTKDDLRIEAYFIENLHDIMQNISVIDKRQIYNAVLAMYTHNIYRDFILHRRQALDRHIYCLKTASSLMSDVSSSLYIDSFDNEDILKADKVVTYVFKKLRSTLEAELQRGDILVEDRDRARALKEIQKMMTFTILNKPWQNKVIWNNQFREVNLTNCFIHNAGELQKRYRTLMYESYGSILTESEKMWTYIKLPYDTDIKTVMERRANIVVPMGAIEYFIMSPEAPKYFLMSDIGFKLAKEMMFYLETIGIKMFTNDRETTNKIMEMNIKDKFHDRKVKLNINVDQFLIERITDSAGAKLAFMTYKRLLNDDVPVLWVNKTAFELFFIHLTQQFCTKRPVSTYIIELFEDLKLHPLIRSNTIAINYKQFSETFKCSQNLPMQGVIEFPWQSEDYGANDVTDMD
ncbi:membrane metallo-endopeptidase-like 1 [Arctopsyche grandis]|uniref:membrane metallo-endopeptidase-like 1 n=1 Tax=Arctopsyche grandis TaxID=121162 RepID=UPI00406D6EFD